MLSEKGNLYVCIETRCRNSLCNIKRDLQFTQSFETPLVLIRIFLDKLISDPVHIYRSSGFFLWIASIINFTEIKCILLAQIYI